MKRKSFLDKLRLRYLVILSTIFILIIFAISVQFGFKAYKYYTERRVVNIQEDFTLGEDKQYSKSDDYQLAVKAYEEKDYESGLRYLKEEINKNPDHAQAYFLLGKIFEDVRFDDGKYFSKMQYYYEMYLSIKPKGIRAEYVKLKLAQYYLREGLKSKNETLLAKAKDYLLSLDQTNGMVKMGLGAIYMNSEKYEQAIIEFERAVTLPDEELKLKYSSLGLAYIKTKNWDKAEKYLQVAVKIDPSNKYVHYMLGFTYMKKNKLEDAELSFKEALMLDPKYKYAKINLRRVQKALKIDKNQHSDIVP